MSLYKIAGWRPGLSLLLLLYGCSQRSDKTEMATTTKLTQSDTLCFLQVIGRDSTTLRLIMHDSTVTGELRVLPFEKDRAQGSIQGTLRDNQIIADWQRSGEGVTQPHELIFTLKGDSITWREGERIEKKGTWILKNPEQGYTYILMKTTCP